MTPSKQFFHLKRRGTVLLISMIFIVVFSALAVSMATLSGTNAQLASNQHKVGSALLAAQSGLECGKYIVATATLDKTGHNYVTNTEANTTWTKLCQHLQTAALDGQTVQSPVRFTDSAGSGDQIITSSLNFGSTNTAFTLSFYRYDSDPRTIKLQATGTAGQITRQVSIDLKVTKDSKVLSYAVATRGRMWLTGDTTIHGDIFSSWNCPEISPFNMTSDSTVLGTINTVLTLQQIQNQDYQLETLDSEWQPYI